MTYKVLSLMERFEVYINGAFYCSVGNFIEAISKVERYKKGVI